MNVDARLGLTAARGVRPHYGDQDPGGPQKLDVAANAAKFAELKSSDKGLTSDEAKARLAKNGLERFPAGLNRPAFPTH